MCPGGTVVAAASEPGRVVTNGMSQYSRNERNANAGIVVGITPERLSRATRWPASRFQRHWEERAFELGGGDYSAPGQLVGDFLARQAVERARHGAARPTSPACSSTDLGERACRTTRSTAIREALPAFGRQIKGFAMDDAVLTGVETRTSSPIRITRDDDSLQSLNTRGLYPAGEGAGYAGGILSAGVDGIRVAEAVALSLVESARSQ